MRNPPRKNSKRKPHTSISHLPEEVLLLILHKLPNTTLVLCTSICKYWYTLIKNSNFISTHLGLTLSASKNTTINDPLLFLRQFPNGLIKYALNFGSPGEEEKGQMFIASPKRNAEVPIFVVIGLCNGLVCLGDYSLRHIVLWNPWIRKRYALPKSGSLMLAGMDAICRYGGLGFDLNENDYKVLQITQFTDKFEGKYVVKLYSLNSNSWKTIDESFLSESDIIIDYQTFGRLCFASGSLHYTAARSADTDVPMILGFNVENEAFHEIMLPESLRGLHVDTLQVVSYDKGSSIAVQQCDSDRCEIWVMKTYAVVESWTRLLIVTNVFCQPKAVGFRKDGMVLIQMHPSVMIPQPALEDFGDIEVEMKYGEGSLVLCNPQSKKFEHLRSWRKHGRSYISSMKSLVLLDKENNNSMKKYGVMVQRKDKPRKVRRVRLK